VRRICSGLLSLAIITFIMFVVAYSYSFQLHDMTQARTKIIDFNAADNFRLFDIGKPIYGSPSSSSGFEQHEGIHLQVSYPRNWTKETVPLVKYTGLQSVPEVAFYVPNKNVEVTISTERPGNIPLSKYFLQEVTSLQDAVSGYVFIDSGESSLGNLTAKKLLYTSDMIEGGTTYGRMKTMELVSIHKGISYFFVYRADESDFQKYLPVVQEMINSFVFKRI
jgi:hypothetical protein